HKSDSLLLDISFEPAFNEHSETIFLSSDSTKSIQILIRNDVRADTSQDTFYFRRIYLSNKQYIHLDSTLIRLCQQKLGAKYWTGCCDGMTINTRFIYKSDT